MVNRVYIDSDGLIQIWVIGDQTHETVREMGEKIGYFIEQQRHLRRPVLVLDNLQKMGHTTSQARGEVARLAKTLTFDRAAMVGDGSAAMRYGTNLMMRAVGRSNVRYFSSLDSARIWLLDL